jgi:beta-glucosidase
VVPTDPSHLPPFDKNAEAVEYGYFHGYKLLDKQGIEPAYHFGHGLSYTEFRQTDPQFKVVRVDREQDSNDGSEVRPKAANPGPSVPTAAVEASCTVANTGAREGDQVIQFYVGLDSSKVERPVKSLKGFRRISLEPGESRRVTITCSLEELARYNPETGEWELEKGRYTGHIGPSSNPEELLSGKFSIGGNF